MEAEPIIELKGLCKTYQSKNTQVNALDGIDLTIRKGDIFGVIGMSGAGKSTLVRCINLLERPTSGQVLVDGKDMCGLNRKQLLEARRSIGMIFQQFNLLMQRTALGNVCFPMEIAGYPREKARARAQELLELVDLSDRANSYPTQLSGGQKQRVAIARALATNPKVLLCDEATSALDPNTTRSILALLQDINKRLGITIVIITHEMSVIEQICNRVAVISESKIAEEGFVRDLFSQPKTAAAQRFVFPDGPPVEHFQSKRWFRLVFDGNSSFEPIIANMILECKTPVNIMYADTKDIDGKAFGQMVVQLPDDDLMAARMLSYVKARGLTVEEVNGYVG